MARSSNAIAAHARVRRSRRAASRAGRRRRRRRSTGTVGSEPDARRVSDPRTRPDRHQRSDPEADRRAVDPRLQHAPSAIVRIPIIPGTTVHVFEMGDGGPQAELHVAVQPDLPPSGQGAGGVHHVAFRTPDGNYDAWADRLNEFDIPNSGKVDRFWFRSLYVREPNGVTASRSRPTGPGSPWMRIPRRLAKRWCSRRSWNPTGARLSPI